MNTFSNLCVTLAVCGFTFAMGMRVQEVQETRPSAPVIAVGASFQCITMTTSVANIPSLVQAVVRNSYAPQDQFLMDAKVAEVSGVWAMVEWRRLGDTKHGQTCRSWINTSHIVAIMP